MITIADIIKEKFCNIKFSAGNHKYSIDSFEFPISSTGRVHQFVNPFDAKLHATRVAEKRSKELMRDVTVQEILDERKEKGREATDEIGTPFHECMEMMLTKNKPDWYKNNIYSENKINPKLHKILKWSKQFYEDYIVGKELTPIMSEVIAGDTELLVAGQIDQIMQTKDQTDRSINKSGDVYIDLRDWKTSKDISKKGYGKKMKGVFNKYPDSNYYHYSLQLSLYKYLLEKNIDGLTVENMYIGHFGYLKDEYNIIPTVDMSKEIKEFFEKEKELF